MAAPAMHLPDCPLCQPASSVGLIWHDARLRVVDAGDPIYPGYTRVIWNAHISEMTDLDPEDRSYLMDTVWRVEAVLRAELAPGKVNVAQLGNQVPHLHWHVIPRWPLDPHYPDSIWSARPQRSPEQALAWEVFHAQQAQGLADYRAALRRVLNAV